MTDHAEDWELSINLLFRKGLVIHVSPQEI